MPKPEGPKLYSYAAQVGEGSVREQLLDQIETGGIISLEERERLARSAYANELNAQLGKVRTEARTLAETVQNVDLEVSEAVALVEQLQEQLNLLLQERIRSRVLMLGLSEKELPQLDAEIETRVAKYRNDPVFYARKVEQSVNGLVGYRMRRAYETVVSELAGQGVDIAGIVREQQGVDEATRLGARQLVEFILDPQNETLFDAASILRVREILAQELNVFASEDGVASNGALQIAIDAQQVRFGLKGIEPLVVEVVADSTGEGLRDGDLGVVAVETGLEQAQVATDELVAVEPVSDEQPARVRDDLVGGEIDDLLRIQEKRPWNVKPEVVARKLAPYLVEPLLVGEPSPDRIGVSGEIERDQAERLSTLRRQFAGQMIGVFLRCELGYDPYSSSGDDGVGEARLIHMEKLATFIQRLPSEYDEMSLNKVRLEIEAVKDEEFKRSMVRWLMFSGFVKGGSLLQVVERAPSGAGWQGNNPSIQKPHEPVAEVQKIIIDANWEGYLADELEFFPGGINPRGKPNQFSHAAQSFLMPYVNLSTLMLEAVEGSYDRMEAQIAVDRFPYDGADEINRRARIGVRELVYAVSPRAADVWSREGAQLDEPISLAANVQRLLAYDFYRSPHRPYQIDGSGFVHLNKQLWKRDGDWVSLGEYEDYQVKPTQTDRQQVYPAVEDQAADIEAARQAQLLKLVDRNLLPPIRDEISDLERYADLAGAVVDLGADFDVLLRRRDAIPQEQAEILESLSAADNKLSALQMEHAELGNRLAGLGWRAFAEKKQVNTRISEILAEIATINAQRTELNTQLGSLNDEARKLQQIQDKLRVPLAEILVVPVEYRPVSVGAAEALVGRGGRSKGKLEKQLEALRSRLEELNREKQKRSSLASSRRGVWGPSFAN